MKEVNPNKHQYFLIFNAVFMAACFMPLLDLMRTTLRSDTFSYIPFIPFITAYLIYASRRAIFSHKETSLIGLVGIGIGLLCSFVGLSQKASLSHYDYLSFMASSMVLIWIGGFMIFYGMKSARTAAFPLLFLLFMVPVPGAMLDKFIVFLQTGSAEAAWGFMRLAGIPVSRDGFVFHLVTTDIEVAKECSGIRSSLSMIITGLLAGHFFLQKGWTKAVLVLAILPITILKNGFRIAMLSILGVYVDERILGSELHRNGGILFFLMALVLVWGVVVVLRKIEGKSVDGNETQINAERSG